MVETHHSPFSEDESPRILNGLALTPLLEDLDSRIALQAFGQNISIQAPNTDFLRADSLWRLQHIYQPALATQTLAAEGVALDIGAGFGVFALPFALAYPGWRVFCFEPDLISFACLQRNILDLALENVTALPFAVGYQKEDAPQDPMAVRLALENVVSGQVDGIDRLTELLPLVMHSKSNINAGYLERGCISSMEFDLVQVPTLSAAFLDSFSPRLLKLIAPKVEADILFDLSQSKIDHIIGESWGHIPSALIYPPSAGQRQTWMRRAGQSNLALRRMIETDGRSSRLDIVLALPKEECDLTCIEALLVDSSVDMRVIVVGDGPADQEARIKTVARHDPRLRFFTAPEQGKSAFWNFGRLQSTATHIAFVDGASFPEKGFFSNLLDVARQTWAEVVQGPYYVRDGNDQKTIISGVSPQIASGTPNSSFEPYESLYKNLAPSSLMLEVPSIWRRVYRRDFLDNRNIWFPENFEANADFVFQSLTLTHIFDVPESVGVNFMRRANFGPVQDHAFSNLQAFKLLLDCAEKEGWNDLRPLLQGFAAQINRASHQVAPVISSG